MIEIENAIGAQQITDKHSQLSMRLFKMKANAFFFLYFLSFSSFLRPKVTQITDINIKVQKTKNKKIKNQNNKLTEAC